MRAVAQIFRVYLVYPKDQLRSHRRCVPSIDGYRLLATQRVDAVMREDDLAQLFAGGMATPAKPRQSAGSSTDVSSSFPPLKRISHGGFGRQHEATGEATQSDADDLDNGSGSGSDSGGGRSSSSSGGGSGGGSGSGGSSSSGSSSSSSSSSSTVGDATRTDSVATKRKDVGTGADPKLAPDAVDRPYVLSQSAKRRLRRLRLKNFLRAEQGVHATGGPSSEGDHVPGLPSSPSSTKSGPRHAHGAAGGRRDHGQIEHPASSNAVGSSASATVRGTAAEQGGRKRRRGSGTSALGAQPAGNAQEQQLSSLTAMLAARRLVLEQQHAATTAAAQQRL